MPSYRNCEVVQQVKFLEGFPDWKATLIAKLDDAKIISAYAGILHDRDINESNDPVTPHIHLVLKLNDSYKTSTIANCVGVPENCVVSIRQKIKSNKSWKKDIGGALAYLTHKNAPEKYPYDDSEVFASEDFDWQGVRDESIDKQNENKAVSRVIEEIKCGSIRRYNIASNTGIYTYVDHRQEFNNAFEYREKMLRASANRNILTVYIFGAAGIGKTTLAKNYCEKQGLDYCVSGSSRDPLELYGGQDALILDDLRPQTFTLSDLLKILDPNTNSAASSRYHDKFLEAKVIIVTTPFSLEVFYEQMSDLREPYEQLSRRCKIIVNLTEDKMVISEYDPTTKTHIKISEGENPVQKMFTKEEKTLSDAERTALCEGFGITYSPKKQEGEVDE